MCRTVSFILLALVSLVCATGLVVPVLSQPAELASRINATPIASKDCLVTAEGANLTVDLTANDHDPDGDSLHIVSLTQPAEGRVELQSDGRVRFSAGGPGRQTFRYRIADDRGGEDAAEVVVLVNAQGGQIPQPVIAGLDTENLAALARACVSGAALDTLELRGTTVTVPLPELGQQIEVAMEPGQQVEMPSAAFASATFILVEGSLLVLTEDGRLVLLRGFLAAAEDADPPTLSVAGGPAIGARSLLAGLQPLTAPAVAEVVGRVPQPEAGGGPGRSVLTSLHGYLFDAGAEDTGYGLYTYVLIPFPSARAERLLDNLFKTTASRKTSALDRALVNLIYLPAVSEFTMDLLFGEDPLSVSWFVADAYNYSLARDILLRICAKPPPKIEDVCSGDLSSGPYIFTYGKPASDIVPVVPPFLFVDLSGTHEDAFAEVIASYKAQVKKPDYTQITWLEALRLDVLNLLLEARDLTEPTLTSIGSVAKMIDFVKDGGR